MYADVRLPTNGSERADRAVAVGVERAARSGATVHALYVTDSRAKPADCDRW